MRSMPTVTDPQIAVLITNMQNLSAQFDRMLASQERTEQGMSEVPLLRKDYEHLADSLRQLHTLAEVRAVAHHQMDKRILILERWHKFMLAQPAIILTVVIAAWGYWSGFTSSLEDFKGTTKDKIQTLEFIVNAPTYERAMKEGRPPAAGGKD